MNVASLMLVINFYLLSGLTLYHICEFVYKIRYRKYKRTSGYNNKFTLELVGRQITEVSDMDSTPIKETVVVYGWGRILFEFFNIVGVGILWSLNFLALLRYF